MLAINALFNRIHEWGEPEQRPATRIVLTRLGGVAGSVIETFAIAYSSLNVGLKFGDTLGNISIKTISALFPKSRLATNLNKLPASLNNLKNNLLHVCKLIIGLASTLLLGTFFSPELNFRLHLKLGLVVDNLNIKKQKELKAKLTAETKAAEITQARASRFSQFQAERQAAKELQEQENAIDRHLAELLQSSG